jgi:hypothetical protein
MDELHYDNTDFERDIATVTEAYTPGIIDNKGTGNDINSGKSGGKYAKSGF